MTEEEQAELEFHLLMMEEPVPTAEEMELMYLSEREYWALEL